VTHPGCRISRVRPKGSKLGQVVILPPADAAKERAHILGRIRTLLESHKTLPDGWAFVVWDEKMCSSSDFVVGKSFRSGLLVPDFVRERLMANRILDWAEQDARHLMGLPPSDDSA
jgi:hypothetical protein